MPDSLLIRPDDPQARQWHWRDTGAAPVAGAGPLSEAVAAAAGRRVVLLVPGEDVLLTQVQIPLRARARAASAAPWALEDRVVADVETLHVALGAVSADSEWSVAVVAHATLERYLAACAEAGIVPQLALPEPLALAHPEPGNWTALEEPHRVVCRTAEAGGFACEPSMLAVISRTLETPAAVTAWRVDDAAVDWPGPLDERIERVQTVSDRLQAFVAGVDQPAIDLLQGPYSRRERMGRLWRRWRVPAALAAALLLLLLVDWVLGYRELGQRQQALQAATVQVLRAAVPDVGRVVNPRVQLKNRLEALRGNGSDEAGGLLRLLGRAGTVLAQDQAITLTALDWRNDTLDLTVEAGELPLVDRFQRALQAAGLEVELRGVKREQDTVRGEVRVREPAA